MGKILVVDIAASEGGALSVLEDYYDKAKDDKNNEYVFLLSDNYLKETDNIEIKILKKEKKRLRRFLGRNIVKKINPDEILSLQNTIIRGTKKKQTVFVHQAIPFQKIKKFSFFKKKERKLAIIQYFIGHIIVNSIKYADKVIVQTNWMKDAIITKCKVNADKIQVNFPKINIENQTATYNLNNKRFFYPTSDCIYKNNNLIFSCVEMLNREKINDFVIEMTLDGISTKNIKKIGKISRNEVYKKYQESILIFPSYIETLGLPLLEAKNCNSVILASNTQFSHEILDGYNKVYFFNPFNVDELKELMKNFITSEGK